MAPKVASLCVAPKYTLPFFPATVLHLCISELPHNTDLHPPSPLYLGGTCYPILFPILALMLRWFLCANNASNTICTDCWKCKSNMTFLTPGDPVSTGLAVYFLWTQLPSGSPSSLGILEILVCPLQGCQPKIFAWQPQECPSPIFSALAWSILPICTLEAVAAFAPNVLLFVVQPAA